MLAQRGFTDHAILPISFVLATLRTSYVEALTAFRNAAAPLSAAATAGSTTWLRAFVGAAEAAVDQSRELQTRIADLTTEWTDRLATYRSSQGSRPTPRADSAVARLLPRLPEAPVLTAGTLTRILNVSFPAAANDALGELERAGILHRRSIDRGATA